MRNRSHTSLYTISPADNEGYDIETDRIAAEQEAEDTPELCVVCGDAPVYAAEDAMCEDCHQESMSENPNDRESVRHDRRDA